MKLRHITLRNIKEHPSKIILMVVSLAIGVATVVSLYSISKAMYIDLQDKLDEYGANMVIVPKSESLPLTYAGVTVGGIQYGSALLTEKDIAKIRTIKSKANINVIAPKLLGIIPIKGQKVMMAGVRFSDELKIKTWWEIKHGKPPAGRTDVLLGGRVAQQLGLNVGDSIDIKGKNFKIKGILNRVGTQEDDLVYIDLKQAQAILGKPGEVSLIEASAWCKDCPITMIVKQIGEKIPNGKVSAVRQAAQARDAVIAQLGLFSVILSATMIIVAVLIVFTNVLSMVKERRREIGIFRAIGYRKSHILYIFLLESGVAGLSAGIIGYLVGLFGSVSVAPLAVGIDIGVKLDPVLMVSSIFGTMLIAIISSLYPATLAARLNPSEAINTI